MALCACCGYETLYPAFRDELGRCYCEYCYNHPALWFAKPEQIAECKRFLKNNPTQVPLFFFSREDS